ncbi:hypothetical protein [Rathayibacter iranicus]|uniref:Uncharacterized protein n=2 Tax=Rathayibacter iranicus TaxID=59737 RepID=A0AAD1ELE0_9MICO|nr:hypothetical protein [Rathayibacter iranicus]AZZ55017.1 hypothetical protein C7V51_03280 [Rathayibacter iranicus]MWV32259.1 hypothetical protein [Rathayibacter iranicus NCPPB 2253 = VKM Ac-1602]PPI62401.1 hypothetical protein C5E08_03285 [Rathayibacter iranicus]PWJ60810.1 hypothetical protein B0H03_1249 [Rathayibacter iranicus NCPPB 2253 = VKM Ac-1602]
MPAASAPVGGSSWSVTPAQPRTAHTTTMTFDPWAPDAAPVTFLLGDEQSGRADATLHIAAHTAATDIPVRVLVFTLERQRAYQDAGVAGTLVPADTRDVVHELEWAAHQLDDSPSARLLVIDDAAHLSGAGFQRETILDALASHDNRVGWASSATIAGPRCGRVVWSASDGFGACDTHTLGKGWSLPAVALFSPMAARIQRWDLGRTLTDLDRQHLRQHNAAVLGSPDGRTLTRVPFTTGPPAHLVGRRA